MSMIRFSNYILVLHEKPGDCEDEGDTKINFTYLTNPHTTSYLCAHAETQTDTQQAGAGVEKSPSVPQNTWLAEAVDQTLSAQAGAIQRKGKEEQTRKALSSGFGRSARSLRRTTKTKAAR